METLQQVILQEMNELRWSRKHIDEKIREEIKNNPDMLERVEAGVESLQKYMQGQYYASKMKRIEQLSALNLEELVMEIFVGIAYIQREELFTSVTAQLASRLNFSDKVDAIKTVAEIVAVLGQMDVFDITKADRQASLMVVSRIPLSEGLIDYINHSQYLPPMVCEPLELTHNYSSGYLTHNNSLVLGRGNHHDGDLCLDVLNIMNSVPLKMGTDFLSQFEEEPTFDLDTQDKIDDWNIFKKQSYEFYSLLASQGNKFYFNHKVDKRGRIYCQGYHLSTQGTAFKKAMLELADEELVEGI